MGLSASTTPALHEIAARFGLACERERTRHIADTRHLTVALAQVQADIDSLTATLERQTAELDQLSAPPRDSWMGVRFPGEENLSDAAAQQRRAVRHWTAADMAKAALLETQRQLDAAQAHQAHLEAELTARADVARSRVLRYARIADRKAAVYRRALIRRHAQRDQLVERWTTDLCPIPAWVALEGPLPVIENSGAPA